MTPTALDVTEKQNRLRATADRAVAVYVHVPFCHHRCSYCDFNIYAGMKSLYVPYGEAVAEEIAVTAARVGRVRVPSIYIGGGTPSLLPVELIGGLLTAVRTFFDVEAEAEVTLEANPSDVQTGYFAQLRSLGVNRISLGVQSSHADELQLLRRGHSFQDAIDTYRAARQAGFDNVNIDLIYGLPDQPIEKWRATLESAIALQPDHISAYSLQVEERTAMLRWVQNGRVAEPDDDDVATMYELTQEMLTQSGFEHYEISNWAKVGQRDGETEGKRESLRSSHNLVYWHNEPYFGFGCGAHSSFENRRYSNVLHPREYIERIQRTGTAIVEEEQIDRALEMGETMMLGLRLIEEGVEHVRFADRFGTELDKVYGAIIQRLTEQDLLESDNQRVRLTSRGRLLGNRVFGEFLPDGSQQG
jgi:oxygen-independent coproporphyrinogen III oxidase